MSRKPKHQKRRHMPIKGLPTSALLRRRARKGALLSALDDACTHALDDAARTIVLERWRHPKGER